MDSLLGLAATVAAITFIIAARYVLVSGGFAWWTGRRHASLYHGRQAQMRSERAWSLASCAIYALPAGFAVWAWQARGWTQIYTQLDAWPLTWLPGSILIYLFLHDTWFYWTHRWMHSPALFRRAHAVHHASRPPTAWAAMSFHPLEAISGAVIIPGLMFLIPIHVAALAVVLTIMTVMGVANHVGWEMFPARLIHGRLGQWLITAHHHQRHHSEYRCNYGLYFRFWDRLCHTDHGLGSFGDSGGAKHGRGPIQR